MKHLTDFNLYRASRLSAYLRTREADGTINGSILVYHVGIADLRLALDGPPPEKVSDPRLSGDGLQQGDPLGQVVR
jgi:hypothetical protein